MATAATELEISPNEFIVRERQAEFRHEYVAGRVYAMSCATRQHNLVAVNVSSGLHSRLRGRPCEVYAADMRVGVEGAKFYAYPDVVVVCGEPRFEDGLFDTLLNPTVIIEILSPSTASYDKGDKFAYYQRISSLQDYLLISPTELNVIHYTRQGEIWHSTALNKLGDALNILSIDCHIPLADVYDKVPLEKA